MPRSCLFLPTDGPVAGLEVHHVFDPELPAYHALFDVPHVHTRI
jgi:hypothetical protein